MFTIHSVSSSRQLVFRSRRGDEFDVELLGVTPTAKLRVSAYMDEFGLNNFFYELSDMQMPWQGTRSWKSLEGEFLISAICTTLGQVIFNVVLRNMFGTTEEWRVEFGLEVELGMLSNIGKDSKEFFKNN